MYPVKWTIPGDFWDCQLYDGMLFLWSTDGDMEVLNWEQLVGSMVPHNELLAMLYTQAHLFYPNRVAPGSFRYYPEELVREQVVQEIPPRLLAEARVCRADNPFGSLPVDTDLYWGRALAATHQGLRVIDIRGTLHGLGRRHFRVDTLWEEPVYSVRVKYGTAAVAAGKEGLCELALPHGMVPPFPSVQRTEDEEPGIERLTASARRLSKVHCTRTSWLYSSIYGTSGAKQQAALAAFTPGAGRHFTKVYSPEDIFRSTGVSWASHDKIYCTAPGGLKVVQFDPSSLHDPFRRLDFIPFQERKGRLLRGDVAYFGVVVDCEDALVVIQSDGDVYNMYEGATRLRMYKRDQRYCNQLHAVFDDRVELMAFAHDFRVPQQNKYAGLRFPS